VMRVSLPHHPHHTHTTKRERDENRHNMNIKKRGYKNTEE